MFQYGQFDFKLGSPEVSIFAYQTNFVEDILRNASGHFSFN